MTRRSKRELERAVESAETGGDDDPTTVLVVPDGAKADEELPDVDEPTVDAIFVEHTEELPLGNGDGLAEFTRREAQVPLHKPAGDPRLSGVSLLTHSEIAHLWASMPEDVRDAERELREERGEPIPPVLQEAA